MEESKLNGYHTCKRDSGYVFYVNVCVLIGYRMFQPQVSNSETKRILDSRITESFEDRYYTLSSYAWLWVRVMYCTPLRPVCNL